MSCPFLENNSGDDKKEDGEINYNNYLQLDKLLVCTKPKSTVHDEHLFIIVHQVYELWFKQIIYDINSVRDLFEKPEEVTDTDISVTNGRLARIVHICKILVAQLELLETITPLEFGKFRGGLGTASGFESFQFRLFENKLGVKSEHRTLHNNAKYTYVFQRDKKMLECVEKSELEPSLFDRVRCWLETASGTEGFWSNFKAACEEWFSEDMKEAEAEEDETIRKCKLKSCQKTKDTFNEILLEEVYEVLAEKGLRSLSWLSFKAALMIFYKRNDITSSGAFQILSHLMDIDVQVTSWRFRHSLMVQREIGSKLGTGGSSGYEYLRSTARNEKYRPFSDFFQLSNYIIPCKYIHKYGLF